MPVNFSMSPTEAHRLDPRETDYFFGNVPPSVKALKAYILIYKRNP
jgi:hypothetical protein